MGHKITHAVPRRILAVALLALSAACGPSAERAEDVTVKLSFEPAPYVGEVRCTVALTDAQGAPVEGADLELEGNMNHAGMVPVFASPREVAAGAYEAPLEFTMGGDWIVIVTGTLADGRALDTVVAVDGVPTRAGGCECCSHATVAGATQ